MGIVVDELELFDPTTGERTRSETRYHVVDGELVVVSVVRYETIENSDTGEVIHRVVSDRREGYALVTRDGDTRTAEFYTDEDELVLVVTQVRNPETGRLEIRRDFYSDGEILRTVEGSIRYRFEDGVLTITRERNGEESRVVTISETEDGFVIEKDGTTYFVTVEDGQMTIATNRGIFVLIQSATGEWEIAS